MSKKYQKLSPSGAFEQFDDEQSDTIYEVGQQHARSSDIYLDDLSRDDTKQHSQHIDKSGSYSRSHSNSSSDLQLDNEDNDDHIDLDDLDDIVYSDPSSLDNYKYPHVNFNIHLSNKLKGRKLLYFTSIFSSIGVFLFGFEQGVMSLIITEKSFLSYFDSPSSIQIGTLIALLELSALISSLCVPYVADNKGRKYTIITGAFIFCIGGLFQALAPYEKIWVMMIGRVISGCGIGFLSSIINLYQSECSPNDQRGLIAALAFTGNISGFCSSIWLDFACSYLPGTSSWKIPLLTQVLLGSVLFFGGFFIVESPRWLLANDLDTEGYRVLKLFNDDDPNRDKAKIEFFNIKAVIDQERLESTINSGSWLSIVKKNKRVITIGASSLFFAQFNGINLISYYAPLIFEKVGFEGKSAFIITGINAIIYWLSTFIAWVLVDKPHAGGGRRKLLIVGGLIMGVCMFLSGFLEAVDKHWASIIVAILIVVYNAAFGFSWGPLAWLYASEVYADSHTRSVGASLGTAVNWFCNFVVGEVSPLMLDVIGWRLYLIYGSCCFVSCVVVYKFYPETSGVELEDMNELFDEFYKKKE
ncbi:hypothetical protein CANARDRAFT_5483 [[Candida] arabinofermentans NRRL YB-2248]|uniref:Major facilitator superfamily (MFS) profile domain-containing protein n=1 Tax=[Candida] arabinofermentans NRRL YB-2248 TaxID=983967 RepID=A0A1E4T8W2_9ASCO|nr:hypothetical protein CANARDRAFT_5483 [[Candida] arabinofermentans NRRL YB-2248]